ncbi:MAG: Cytosine permease [Parcubacteria bacterium OLB19]|nr:MAG: Cytosine permease [Parcubacteria bacterium OLB19]
MFVSYEIYRFRFSLFSSPCRIQKSFIEVFFVWVGYVMVVGVMVVGGGLATQATLEDILFGIMLGNCLLGVFALFSGYIGAHSNRTFYQLIEGVFSGWSARIIGLYVPIILICWYAIESSILGGFIGKLFGFQELGQSLTMVAVALLIGGSVYVGFRALKNLSLFFVPIIFVLAVYATFSIGVSSVDLQISNVSHDGVSYVASIVLGTWIMGVLTNLPDVTRFSRSTTSGAMAGFVGILIGNSFNLLIGVFTWYFTRQSDPSEILMSLGFLSLALLFAVSNIWTTNDSNMYSATLNLARVLSISRRQAVVLGVLVGAIGSFFNPAQLSFIFDFVLAMGITAPALGGVVLGGYVMKEMFGHNYINVVGAWSGLLIGCSVAYVYVGIVGVVFSFLIAWLMMAVVSRITS